MATQKRSAGRKRRGSEFSAETRREAVAAVAAGRTLRDVARQIGVGKSTLQRWVGAAPKPAGQPEERDAGQQTERDVGSIIVPGDTLATAKAMLEATLEMAMKAQKAENYTAAQRAMRDASQHLNTIARLEKAEKADETVLRISRAEIAEAMLGVRERVKTLVSRPLLCAHCSRKLSASFGGKQGDVSDVEPGAAEMAQ